MTKEENQALTELHYKIKDLMAEIKMWQEEVYNEKRSYRFQLEALSIAKEKIAVLKTYEQAYDALLDQ